MKPRAKSIAPVHLELICRQKPIAVTFLILSVLFSASIYLAEGSNGEDNAASRERQLAQQFEAQRQNPEELRAFFLAMPKGGDIHNHYPSPLIFFANCDIMDIIGLKSKFMIF